MKAVLNNPNDAEIIEGIFSNESWAYEKLYKLNMESFFNYVRMNNGSSDDAKDVLQDAIIILHEKVKEESLELTCSLKTYLTAVCNNLWYKQLRRKNKLVKMPETFGLSISDLESEEEQFTEIQEKLMKHFRNLGESCQELLTNRFWKKKKFKVIAEELGKNLVTVRMESSRCIRRLYEMYSNKS